MICKKCATETTPQEKIFSNGTKHIQNVCLNCGTFNGYQKQNKDPGDFVMPFGKYKGKPLSIIRSEDESYLYWLKDNCQKDNLKAKLDDLLSTSF